MICKKCGATIPDDAIECPACGANQKEEDQEVIHPEVIEKTGTGYFYEGPKMSPIMSSGKSKLKAALLALFLGWLGIHNFYLGYTSKGSAQLILGIIVIGIPFSLVWSFVEFIMIILGYYKTVDGEDLQ